MFYEKKAFGERLGREGALFLNDRNNWDQDVRTTSHTSLTDCSIEGNIEA